MRTQTESHRLIEHLMIAANEAVARLLSERGTPCLYRVHERPEPERVKRLVDQLASLEVPTPPVPRNMSPSQAAELMGEISRRVETARATCRAWTRGADLAGPALAPAGRLLAEEQRPRRARHGPLLPFHLADPPLPRPRLSPCAAVRRRRRGARAAGRGYGGAGRVDLGPRAGRDDDRARRGRRGALLCPGAGAVRGWLGAGVRRRSGRLDLSRRVHRFRHRRGGGSEAGGRVAGSTRACCRSGACAARAASGSGGS